MAGIEVHDVLAIPENMEVIVLPECCYAKFTHRGEVMQLDNTVNYIYSNWLFNSGYRHTYGPDLELYGDNYHPTSGNSIIHYTIPIIQSECRSNLACGANGGIEGI